MLNVLDVGFKSSNNIFWFPDVGCVRCGFQENSGSLMLDVFDVGIERGLEDF